MAAPKLDRQCLSIPSRKMPSFTYINLFLSPKVENFVFFPNYATQRSSLLMVPNIQKDLVCTVKIIYNHHLFFSSIFTSRQGSHSSPYQWALWSRLFVIFPRYVSSLGASACCLGCLKGRVRLTGAVFQPWVSEV